MSKNDNESIRNYKVGYGKPPKEHQFKRKDHTEDHNKPTRRRKRTKKNQNKIDVSGLLSAPLLVKADGKSSKMDPFEIMLRKQAKGAVGGSLPAIKAVLSAAIKCELLYIPPIERTGGVLVVRVNVDDDYDSWVKLFGPDVPWDESLEGDEHG